jgi:hypothetical protein
MSAQEISVRIRAGLWRAYECRCFYCQIPITFVELEIDHLLPESLLNDINTFQSIISRLGLPSDFDLHSLDNLVPTHNQCNRRKSDLVFSDSSMRYYIELARDRLSRVKEEMERITVQSTNERILLTIADRIERGLLSREEVIRLLPIQKSDKVLPISEPLIIGFSVNVIVLQASGELPNGTPIIYSQLCDWLEYRLLSTLRAKGLTLVVPCESSERNGETLSIRVASWALDLDNLQNLLDIWWTITEVMPYSEIYDSSPEPLFMKALIQGANKAVRTTDISRPWAFCPSCGSEKLVWSEDSAYHLIDDIYYFVKCQDCNWMEEFK